MTELTGTVPLTAFALRRDRVRIAIWVLSITALVALTVASIKGLYPDQRSLDEAAAVSAGNAAAIAFNGPVQGLDTVGGQVAFQVGAWGMVGVGLMSLLMVGRLTRGEEEAGRLELVRALPVGARAPNAVAVLVVGGMNVIVGVLVTLTLLASDLPSTGSVVFGISFMLLGLVFAAIALVAAQVTENTRVAYGITGAVLGTAFVLRAVGDIGDGSISWLSPIGWAQKTRPFAGERWWPLLPLVLAAAGLVALAARFAARRDLGGGLVAPRPGRTHGAPSLGTPLGLAVRLQRGTFLGWGAGILLTAAAYGSIADSIDEFVGDNEALAKTFAAAAGVSLTDSYLATTARFLALVTAGFVVQAVLRLRGEEAALRAEPVLATPVSRRRWATGHLLVAAVGGLGLLAASGLATGVTYGLVGGGLGEVPRVVGAALVQAPALWVLVGLSVALVGALPRGAQLAWGAFALFLVVGMLGTLLDLPRWIVELSPFEHVPQLPGADLALAPLIVLTLAAALLTGVGLAAVLRRDIG